MLIVGLKVAIGVAFAAVAFGAAIALSGRRDAGNLANLMWLCCGGALGYLTAHLIERNRRARCYRLSRDREVISSFSHDIRAPAAAITMQTDLVRELTQDEEILSRMHAIRAAATRILNLAQNMVDSIRIEEGEMALRIESVDLNSLVSETVLEQESLARAKRIDVALDLAPALPRIDSDPLQLKRVIINLLGNAINMTPGGGRIVLSTAMASESVRISVKDGGPGINPGERNQLFARYSGLARRNRGGIGLGLFIVKNIVTRCGGSIEVESVAGDGATFSVILPIRPPGA